MIEASKVDYSEWTARKEQAGGEPVLHIYIELNESDTTSSEQLKPLIRAGLQEVIPDFKDLEYMLGSDHLLVTRLANNSFQEYMEDRRRAGSDLAHVKPPHMQPSNDVIKRLLGVG